MERTLISGIDCLIEKRENSKGCFIILHGYGASCEDLAGLMPYLENDEKATWVFPNGIIGTPYGGRAWFPIDEAALEKAMMSGTHRDFADARPGGMNEAHDRLMKLVNELQGQYDWVILGGFSQGAMMTMDLSLKMEKPPATFLLFSGALVDEANWSEASKKLQGIKFFQSHGQRDPLLSFTAAEKLQNMLNSNGLDGIFVEFQGEHEIPLPVIQQAKSFLKDILKNI